MPWGARRRRRVRRNVFGDNIDGGSATQPNVRILDPNPLALVSQPAPLRNRLPLAPIAFARVFGRFYAVSPQASARPVATALGSNPQATDSCTASVAADRDCATPRARTTATSRRTGVLLPAGHVDGLLSTSHPAPTCRRRSATCSPPRAARRAKDRYSRSRRWRPATRLEAPGLPAPGLLGAAVVFDITLLLRSGPSGRWSERNVYG